MSDTSTIVITPTSTVNDLSDGRNTETIIYTKATHYEPHSSKSMNHPNTHCQVDQPESTSNNNSKATIIRSAEQIESYISWSIWNILCCCLCIGCVACYYSSNTKHFKKTGDIQRALKASDQARVWNIVATIIGLLFWVLNIIRFSIDLK